MTETAQSRPRAAGWGVGWGVGEAAVALVGLAWIALAAFWAAPAPFTVDGFVYQAMIDAIARDGSLFLENGYREYSAEALKLQYVVGSGDRLAPQYPGGWGILAAPAYLAGGIRGVMILNAVASALTLLMIWITAEALFQDRRVAVTAALIYALATFAVDYAVGFWPHAVTTLLVTSAVAAAARGWRGNAREELLGFLLAGFAIGVATNIRVDGILAAIGLSAWILGAARKPYTGLLVFGLGLAPGLAAATWINYVKFGRLAPVSYGKSGGAASLTHYADLLPIMAVVGLAFLSLGTQWGRKLILRPAGFLAALAITAAIILVVPTAGELTARIARGAYALMVNFQAIPFPGWGLELTEEKTITAWGLDKKALLQSLPYAAAILVLAPCLIRGPDRGGLALCVLFCLPFIAFFSLSSWHGGGNNMRYFLNFVPILSILSAMALRKISALAVDRTWPGGIALIATVAAAVLYALLHGYPTDFLVQHTLPLAIVIGLTGLSILLAAARGRLQGLLARGMLSLMMLGFATAFAIGWGMDAVATQMTRARNAEIGEHAERLPENALVITKMLEASGFRLNQGRALTAYFDFRQKEIDADLNQLVAHAFTEGRPVFVQGRELAEKFVADRSAEKIAPRFGLPDRFDFYRLVPPDARSRRR